MSLEQLLYAHTQILFTFLDSPLLGFEFVGSLWDFLLESNKYIQMAFGITTSYAIFHAEASGTAC